MTPSAYSKFVWFDLMTPDVPGAKAFYGQVTGWKTEAPAPNGYQMWSRDGITVGGVMESTAPGRKFKTLPAWLGHVLIESLDAKVKQVEKLGGTVTVPPMNIPDVGRFSVVTDPQGAAFSLFETIHPEPGPDRTQFGNFCWAELNTTDRKAAFAFYAELLGWKRTTSRELEGGIGEYQVFGFDEKNQFGGMSDAAKVMQMPPHWMFYVYVPDVDESVREIGRSKGKVMRGPIVEPDGGRIVIALDPQGAIFGVYSSPQ